MILGLLVARGANSRNPSKLQLVFEMLVDWVNKQVAESMGISVAPFVVPLSVALFFFILVSNWLEVIPSGHNPEYLPAPTADVNLTYALALLVIIPVHIMSIRRRGFLGYIKHYFKPFPLFFPINVIEELAKPLTLALRPLRQHLRRRHHDLADLSAACSCGAVRRPGVEALRHVHRGHPGLHLLAAHDSLFRFGNHHRAR